MGQNRWVRALDCVIESCWLLALVAVPIFFDTMTVRIFEPDKIVLFRNIVLVMVLATLLRAILTAPGAMARAAALRAAGGDAAQDRVGSRPGSPPAGTGVLPAPSGGEGDAGRRTPWWRAHITRRPMLIPVIIFTLVYTAATVHSVLPGISFWGSYDRLQGLYTWLSYVALFAVLAYNLRSWAQIERIVSALAFTSVPVAIYGIMQHMHWDPVQWGAPTDVRVAGSLGNAIFLGAYLIMCMPFVAYRLWLAVERMRTPDEQPPPNAGPQRSRRRPKQKDVIEITGLPPIVPVVGYALALVLDFAALYFTGSRGPYYGFVAAVCLLGIPLTLKWYNPYPAIAGIILAVVFFAFPDVVSALNPALAAILLVVAVALGVAIFASSRVATVLNPAVAGLALLVAIFAFPQAVNVLNPGAVSVAGDSQHLTDLSAAPTSEVRLFIWKGSVPLIAHRAILGWGPETMIYVYSPYYPSGLGHIERSNAAPDRNHDVWLDFLVFSGVLGLLAWLAVLAAFAYVILTVLRRVRSRHATLLASAILAAVVGHLAEATVGIPIVSTLMLLWTLFGVATVLYARRELIGEEATAAEPAAVAREPVLAAASGSYATVGAGAVAVATKGRSGGRNGSRANQGRKPARGQVARAPRAVSTPPGGAAFERLSGVQQTGLLGLIVLAVGALVGGIYLFANNVQVVRADAAYKVGQAYDNVASACLARAANPADPAALGCNVGPQVTAQQVAQYAGLQLLPTSLSYYQQAITEQPNQDMYYLWMGKTYLDQAHYYLMLRQQASATASFQSAESVLQAARALNPYNADHPMNLARMFSGWAKIDPSKWALADRYYRIAIQLSPHNGRWADEWGNADMSQAATRPGLTPAQRTALYRQALQAFQHGCAVDDLLGDARIFRGLAYQDLGMNRQAAASYQEALRVGGFELPIDVDNVQLPGTAAAAQGWVSALVAAKDYAALVKPVHLGPTYGYQSPMTLAYSPTLGLISTPPFSATLHSIAQTLKQKGLLR